jgi:hypothetical protein
VPGNPSVFHTHSHAGLDVTHPIADVEKQAIFEIYFEPAETSGGIVGVNLCLQNCRWLHWFVPSAGSRLARAATIDLFTTFPASALL